MVNVRMLFALGLAVAVAGGSQAAVVVDTDFTKNAEGWTLNGSAMLQKPEGDNTRPQVLSLVQNEGSQAGVAWTNLKQQVPSFSFITELRFTWNVDDPSGACPADAAALAFADTAADSVGGAGGNAGLFNMPDILARFIALDINTWYGQGLGTGDCHTNTAKGETISFANMAPTFEGTKDDEESGRAGYDRHSGQDKPGDPAKGGFKLGQVALPAEIKLINGGWYRVQWNVDGATNTTTAFFTGLDEANKGVQKVKVLEVKSGPPVLDFSGRWGLAGATGGAVMGLDIARAQIHVPMLTDVQ